MFKRIGEGGGGKKPRVEETLEERLDRERAPLENEIFTFLRNHGCDGTGRIIVNFGGLKVYLLAEMQESYCMCESSLLNIPRAIMDISLQLMRTDVGLITGMNTVSKRVVRTEEINREIQKIANELKVTSTYRIPQETGQALAGYLIDHSIEFRFHERVMYTITFKDHHQRLGLERDFDIGIVESNLDPPDLDLPL